MKLYLLSQDVNTAPNSYDSAVVCAGTMREARLIIPSPFYVFKDGKFYYQYKNKRASSEKTDPSWTHPGNVKVQEIGETDAFKAGDIVCASFNAGFDESRYLDLRRMKMLLGRPDTTPFHRSQIERAQKTIAEQMQDKQLALLRCRLVEANRERDQKQIFIAETKIKDYLKEEFESYV